MNLMSIFSPSNKKGEPARRIFTNGLLWLAFGAVVCFTADKSSQPAKAIDKYYDVGLFWYQVAGAIVLFTIFAVIRRKAKGDAEARSARYYAELALGELGGILINFGSLALVTALVSPDWSPVFATALNYVIGYFLIRKS
ncbi:hypothetical protein CS8_047790 [Cupriavidus sp. 8B]